LCILWQTGSEAARQADRQPKRGCSALLCSTLWVCVRNNYLVPRPAGQPASRSLTHSVTQCLAHKPEYRRKWQPYIWIHPSIHKGGTGHTTPQVSRRMYVFAVSALALKFSLMHVLLQCLLEQNTPTPRHTHRHPEDTHTHTHIHGLGPHVLVDTHAGTYITQMNEDKIKSNQIPSSIDPHRSVLPQYPLTQVWVMCAWGRREEGNIMDGMACGTHSLRIVHT